MAFNTDLMEAVELGFLLDLAETVAAGALRRRESRGGHFREDYPDRDDENFLAHTMAYRREAAAPADVAETEVVAQTERHQVLLGTKPVVITRYQPMERKY